MSSNTAWNSYSLCFFIFFCFFLWLSRTDHCPCHSPHWNGSVRQTDRSDLNFPDARARVAPDRLSSVTSISQSHWDHRHPVVRVASSRQSVTTLRRARTSRHEYHRRGNNVSECHSRVAFNPVAYSLPAVSSPHHSIYRCPEVMSNKTVTGWNFLTPLCGVHSTTGWLVDPVCSGLTHVQVCWRSTASFHTRLYGDGWLVLRQLSVGQRSIDYQINFQFTWDGYRGVLRRKKNKNRDCLYIVWISCIPFSMLFALADPGSWVRPWLFKHCILIWAVPYWFHDLLEVLENFWRI